MTAPQRGPAHTWQHLLHWRENGDIDVDASLDGLPCDDMHAGWLIGEECPGWLHYVPPDSRWYVWNGRCHEPDTSGLVERIVLSLGARGEAAADALRQKIRSDALTAELSDKDTQAQLDEAGPAAKYLAGLRKAAGQRSLLAVLASQYGTPPERMTDQHPHWLNCANGTVDLAAGLLKPHDPADMITYCLDTPYSPGAPCPRFWALLCRAVGNDLQVAEYLVRVLGYCLIGSNPEQQIFFISGPTASGKSKLLEIIGDVLGELAHNSQAALVTVQRHGRNARTENSIRGRRLITITETSAFMTIDEGQVKRLTGEAWISVDQHYARTEIRTPVSFTIVGATNQMPVLTDFDDAMKRRMMVIPGGGTIPEELRSTTIASQILAEERAGILAMLIAAAREYYRAGLAPPHAVAMKTMTYQFEQNTVANFVYDCCALTNGLVIDGTPAHIPQAQAWEQYQQWSRGSSRLGRNEFYDHLARHPGVVRNETSRRFEGITWNARVTERFGTP